MHKYKNEPYFSFYKVQNESTLFNIAKTKNINPKLLSAINAVDENDFVNKDQLIILPKNDYAYYITKEGDSLTSVSEIFGCNPDRLVSENQTIYLHEGQLIVHKAR